MMEGSGSRSVLVTNGSGSRRPKNLRILRSGSPTLLKLPFHGSGSWLFSSVASIMAKKILDRVRRCWGSHSRVSLHGSRDLIHLHQQQCSVDCRVHSSPSPAVWSDEHIHLHYQQCGEEGAFNSIACSMTCRAYPSPTPQCRRASEHRYSFSSSYSFSHAGLKECPASGQSGRVSERK